MADARLVGTCQRRALAIIEVSALDQDREPLAGFLAQCVQGALHKVGADHALVVVQKDHGIMAQDRGNGQAHVADGPVAAQAHALARALGGDLRDAVGDAGGLDVGDPEDIERGVRIRDMLDT